MSSFDNWKEEYGLQSEPNYSEHTKKDCKSAFEAGQQSQQAKIDELQARIDKVVHILTYTNHASTPLCNELRDILKGNKDEN